MVGSRRSEHRPLLALQAVFQLDGGGRGRCTGALGNGVRLLQQRTMVCFNSSSLTRTISSTKSRMMLNGNSKAVRVANPSAKVSQDGVSTTRCSRHDQ